MCPFKGGGSRTPVELFAVEIATWNLETASIAVSLSS
jgi:hypothetical protein